MRALRTVSNGILTCALVLAATGAPAQGYPSKPIRIVSVFPTGISPDTAMRIAADKLTGYFRQGVIVEPRPGGNGFIAIGAAKQAPGDGYTLLLLSNANAAINPNLFAAVPYDMEADFVPVSTIYRAPFFLAVSASGPYQTVPQLIAAAKANPDRITYSTPYIGSPPHLGGASLAHLIDARMVAVHYKDGPQIYSSIASGDISFSLGTLGSVAPLTKAGKLKVLAVAAPARFPGEPGIPTIGEAGGPKDLDVESWVGVVAPRGTPPEVARRISESLARALAEPDVVERYRGLGLIPTASTPEQMAQLIREDSRRYRELVKLTGIKAE